MVKMMSDVFRNATSYLILFILCFTSVSCNLGKKSTRFNKVFRILHYCTTKHDEMASEVIHHFDTG